ncbi:BACON domain-containing protein [Streptomyces albipurpureus]|uniref:BACON domain-containing protein n=1 Tax=Streptomyces albipurpureus TaxID=2897419 RepID=A0ABT0UZ16_9ACTN|nr:hypothetical protein [Streptomyces sp. CWNU-1]MCM2393798.1 hypothetical protein [Streptomyces sp. CWNU-1]
MSSGLEPPTQNTGGHRAYRRAPRTAPQQPSARYEPYLDGLFTYCLSAVCEHDAATVLVAEVLATAERHRGRCPAPGPARTAWLYALARWACLRGLTERRRARSGAHTGRPVASEQRPPVPAQIAEQRRAELALLAWPEAAGTSPEQREALELAVRHGLSPQEVAAVLGLDAAGARELLAAAACEVERTRAALAVVDIGDCPSIARLTGDHRVLLSAALRTELVRHVDDCPHCRRAAERADARGPWPGSTTPATLPMVQAPRAAVYRAMRQLPRARSGTLRFGSAGFPMDPKDHAARRHRMRARAVTTTVVATVVAAPVLALWAAYRGAPLTGEGRAGGSSVSATEAEGDRELAGDPYDRYEGAGRAEDRRDGRTPDSHSLDVTVEVISTGPPSASATSGHPGPGRLAVQAQPVGSATEITLRETGGGPVRWSVWVSAPWLSVSQTSGTLGPGESITLTVLVDAAREPAGAWRARVGVDPAGAVVEIEGHGATAPPTPPAPSPTPSASPSPSPEPPSPTPSPTPEHPEPTTTPPPSSPEPSPPPS